MPLKRHKGKIVGHLTMHTSTRARFPVINTANKTHIPKTAIHVAVRLYKETGNKHQYKPAKYFKGSKKYAKSSLMKASTARQLYLV